jgi:hypothetical protein
MLEGAWLGADKAAHFFFVLAVAGWICAFRPRWYAWSVLIAVAMGLAWEASNALFVFEGERGISLLDLMPFLGGGFLAGILAWQVRPKERTKI